MHHQETLLQVLTAESPTSRVSLWMVAGEFGGESRLRLRQESYSDDVGWFTQTHLDLSPDQLSQLKGGIGFRALQGAGEARAPGFAPRSLRASGVAPLAGNGAAAKREERGATILRFPSVKAG